MIEMIGVAPAVIGIGVIPVIIIGRSIIFWIFRPEIDVPADDVKI
jgi:hypothetical protein